MMNLNRQIINMVEYNMCENAMQIYPKVNSHSRTFRAFCSRLKESIENSNLSSRDERVLRYLMFKATRDYRIPHEDLSVICANFFIEERWDKYIRAIELMDEVKWQL